MNIFFLSFLPSSDWISFLFFPRQAMVTNSLYRKATEKRIWKIYHSIFTWPSQEFAVANRFKNILYRSFKNHSKNVSSSPKKQLGIKILEEYLVDKKEKEKSINKKKKNDSLQTLQSPRSFTSPYGQRGATLVRSHPPGGVDEGCPEQKVLGRVLWKSLARPTSFWE